MSDTPLNARDPRPARRSARAGAHVSNLERVVDTALSAATALRRTPDLELDELRRAGSAVSELCDALADTCGHLAHELSSQDPEPTERAHAAIEHLYLARDALTDAGEATRRTTRAATALHPRTGDAPQTHDGGAV